MNETLTKTGLELAKQIRRHLELGDFDQAERLCTEAMRRFDDDPDVLLQAGNVHYFRKRYGEAARYYRQVQQLRPKDSDARTMLWGTYRDAGDFEQMLQLAQEFEKQPLSDNELFFAYRTYIALCDWHKAQAIQERALKLLRKGRISHGLISAMLIDLCSIPDLPPELVYEIHRLWGDEEIKRKQPYFSVNTPLPPVEGRLKVAYISADFNAHPVGAFMNQIIRSHDRQRFEIYCYAYLERNDAITENFRNQAEHFIDITAMRFDEVAKRIHADGIHLLIDLGGHTTNSRLAVLAYKPAPVQLTYLGYPNTTGLPTVDYRITDHFAESPEGTRYVEKLLQMPQSFLCYGTGLAQQPSDAAPVTKNGHITFASLNHLRKLTPETIRTWSRILNRVPDSRLLMKARAVESGSSLILENVLAEFERHGIKRERIEFLPFTDSHKAHMLQYNEIDVALDSFPYNGTTTTCDALIMGVPVVTLAGAPHAQRVSCSILKNIGFEETITHSADEYVEKAVMLASRPEYLTLLRQILPTLFRHSILCQSETFTRQLEGLYLQAWREKSGILPDIYKAEGRSAPTEKPKINSKAVRRENITADPRTVVGHMASELLAEDPIVVAEIGARILNPDNNAGDEEIFHSLPTAKVLAFEADAEACEQINALKHCFVADIKAYPYALSDKPGQQTLYITKHKMCSSLYKPNEAMLARYANLEVASLSETCPLEVTSLDWFMEQEGIPHIDFIKIDVQGAELDIFNGAAKAMPQLLGICTEVEFVELYQGQPLFADVDAVLRAYGLQLHHFTDAGRVPIRGTSFQGKTQQLWADAIYFPGFDVIDKLPAKQLLKLSVLASLYEAFDLSEYALRRFDKMSDTHYADDFAQRLTAIAQGKGSVENQGTVEKKAKQTKKQTEHNRPKQPTSKRLKQARIANDVLVVVPDDLNLMTPYILEEQQDWFEDEIKFVRHLIKPGMQIIDIGANYGCYALTMAKLAGSDGHIWAFEPCSATADHLEESIRANGLGQLQLIRAALSNRQGTATLSTQENAELNSLTNDNGGSGTETVPLYRLDDCMQEYGWQEIDFMKLDAEGEEIRILEGGADFFRICSPLVMFELKHGATVNEGLIQAFRDLDYDIYKLIPGLAMLVPFDPAEEPDPFQLNLFGCQRQRAEKLQAAGLLSLGEVEGELQMTDPNLWVDYLKESPYAAPLLEQWQQAESGLPGESEYRTALNAYVMAQKTKGRPESHPWLVASFLQLIAALEAHASLPRLLTLARIATDLGRRSAAAQALHQFVEVISREQRFNPVEPFLAASGHASGLDPDGGLANWCLAQALAERERLQAFSSYFTGSNSLSALNIIASLNYDDAEMGRRRELITRRFAK